jgi:hypothetical protein
MLRNFRKESQALLRDGLIKRSMSASVMTGEEIVKSCREYTLWSWSAQQVRSLVESRVCFLSSPHFVIEC